MFTFEEISALTRRNTLSHSQLDARERGTGFAATLEERARADQQEAKATGPEWWLERLMQPVRDMQPPASDYVLAKAENVARKQLNMAPNPDTLFTQHFVEAICAITQCQREPTPEEIEQAMEMAEKAVEREMKAWEEKLAQQREADQQQQQLNQFDSMQAELRRALAESPTDEDVRVHLMSDTQSLFDQLKQLKNNRPPKIEGSAEHQIKTIVQARNETAVLNTNPDSAY